MPVLVMQMTMQQLSSAFGIQDVEMEVAINALWARECGIQLLRQVRRQDMKDGCRRGKALNIRE